MPEVTCTKCTMQLANFLAKAARLPQEMLAEIFEQAPDLDSRNSKILELTFLYYLALSGKIPSIKNAQREQVVGLLPAHWDAFMAWAVMETYVIPYSETPTAEEMKSENAVFVNAA